MTKQYTTEEIVNKLIGDTSWHGETYSDNESLENMDTLESILFSLTDRLNDLRLAYKSHPENYSAKKLGERANSISESIILELSE